MKRGVFLCLARMDRRSYSSSSSGDNPWMGVLGQMQKAFQQQYGQQYGQQSSSSASASASATQESARLQGASTDANVRVTLDASHRMVDLHVAPAVAAAPTHELEDGLREAVAEVLRRAPFKVDPGVMYQRSASSLASLFTAAMGTKG